VSTASQSALGSTEAPARDGIISQRLSELLDDMLAGKAPNAGRFCGDCYHPLGKERKSCPFCGASVAEVPTVEAVPREIIEAHRRRRGREGLVVRTFAWAGLTAGVIIALLPLILAGISIWTGIAFLVLMFGFYVISANLANWIGDELGYRWGLATFRNRWDAHIAERDGDTQADDAGN
jgi:hypothetical protein